MPNKTPPKQPSTKSTFKSGYVSIIGSPNVGKSTLLNALIGEKVSIVTQKAQTTRHRVLGILNQKNAQVLFLDTPGIHATGKLLNQEIVQTAYQTLSEADIVLHLLVPQQQIGPAEAELAAHIRALKKTYWVLINKIDQVNKERLLPLIGKVHHLLSPEEVIPICALSGDGLPELLRQIIAKLPVGPAYYPTDIYTERDLRFLSAEAVREKAFMLLHEEIPYALATQCTDFKEEEKITKILITIFIEKSSQKGIVIGQGGRTLKKIGELARKDLEVLLGRKVYLELFVKVAENWTKNKSMLQELGLLNNA